MTTKQLEQIIIDCNTIPDITNQYTHLDIHTNKTLTQDLDRILTEYKDAQSRFCGDLSQPENTKNNQEHAEFLINEALLYHANNITQFLKTASNLEKREFNTPFDEENYGVVGTGIIYNPINNTLKEYKTSHMCMVLRKDNKMPLGFSLVTAYPDMTQPDIQPTDRNLTNYIKATNAYKNADNVGKTYLRYRTDIDNTHLSTYKKGHTPDDSMMMLHANTDNPTIYHEIKIKESGITLRTISEQFNNMGHKIKTPVSTPYSRLYQGLTGKSTEKVDLMNNRVFQEFAKNYPDIASSLQNIRNHFVKKTQQLATKQTTSIEQQQADKFDAIRERQARQVEARFEHIQSTYTNASYQY